MAALMAAPYSLGWLPNSFRGYVKCPCKLTDCLDNGRKRSRVLRVNQSPWASEPPIARLSLRLCLVGRLLGATDKSTRRE